MAYAFIHEGQTPTGSKSPKPKKGTSLWLKSNNLSHLIPVFTENHISVSELAEMPRDELTEVLSAMGLSAINIPRVRSKIMKLKQNDNNQQPQIQFQRVIITEAEQTAMMSLNNKFQELKQQQNTIQNLISNLQKEHIQQQKIANVSFNEIISNVEKRKSVLLNEMNQKVQKYKNELNTELEKNANNRKNVIKAQNASSANYSASNSNSFNTVQQRSNLNVKLIDETLLQIQQLHFNAHDLKQKRIEFNIDKSAIISDVISWGCIKYEMKFDLAAPTVALINENIYENAWIEILSDENSKATKYEIELYAGHLDEKQMENITQEKNKNVKLVQTFTVNAMDNMAYYEVDQLCLDQCYAVRVRAYESKQVGEYSQWLLFETNNVDDEDESEEELDFEVEDYWQQHVDINGATIKIEKWLKVVERMNVGLSQHEQKRLFYGLGAMHGNRPGTLSSSALEDVCYLANTINKSNKDWVKFSKVFLQFFNNV